MRTGKYLTLLIMCLEMVIAHATPSLPPETVRHVVLLSIDGMHQSDLTWFIRTHPHSALAQLAHTGIEYTHAYAPFPSDSYPGIAAIVTGGHPKSTGIYYDDAYSRKLLKAGTVSCGHTASGSTIHYAANIDRNPLRLDAGEDIPGLYATPPSSFSRIDALTTTPITALIDPAKLPVDPVTCRPLYPHRFIKVNTIFEVAHGHGLRTAWADKHPAYEILSGPSGQGLDELFAPEINSSLDALPHRQAGRRDDFAADTTITELYDGFKLEAMHNWSRGYDHSGHSKTGEPAIFGMNFQTVTTAQRLDISNYYSEDDPPRLLRGPGGYITDGSGQLVPGPVLASALQYIDKAITMLLHDIDLHETVVIITARHGQSPRRRTDLTLIDDDTMIAALNKAWHKESSKSDDLVAHAMDDDSVLLWLNDRSPHASHFATNFLLHYDGAGLGFDNKGQKITKPFHQAGLQKIYAGVDAAHFMGVAVDDSRVPDLIGIAQKGSMYAGTRLGKISEHGGDTEDDRHIALLISGATIAHQVINTPVETTQIAPSILKLLRLDAHQLQAVQREGTRALPGV